MRYLVYVTNKETSQKSAIPYRYSNKKKALEFCALWCKCGNSNGVWGAILKDTKTGETINF